MEHLFKNKKIWLSTFIPIIFSLVVLYLFLPAFNSIEDNLDEINVVMVNSDQDIGTEIVNELEKNSPFTVIEAKSMDEAMKQLEDKTAHMAIEIPESFTEQIQKGEPEITFIIDQARQSTIKSTMEEAVSELTKLLNENVYEMKKGKITAGIEEFYTHIEEISPENKPLMQSKEIIRGALNGLSYQNVQSNIIRLNENNHPLNMVFPLLIFLTLFISALIRSFAYDQEVAKAQSPHWHIFWHKQ
ncbi:MAG TPA: ABC transporter permease, partial [Pseudogracilibacillus sp.]|nr:ABC transporter permease [Pseudogracilibacillus sp.]